MTSTKNPGKLIFKITMWFFVIMGISAGMIWGWRYVRKNYNGKALARIICDGFNKNRRGRMEIESVEWNASAVLDYITGSPVFVRIKGLKLYDVRGKKVVDVPYASGRIFVEPLRKNMNLIFDEVKVHNGKISLEMFDSPDDPSSSEIGLLALFNSAKTDEEDDDDGPSAHSFRIAVNHFDLKNIDIEVSIPALDMNLTEMSLKGGHIFYQTESREAPFKFHLSGLPKVLKGKCEFLGKPLDIKDVDFKSGYMDPDEPWELHFALTAKIDDRPVQIRSHLGNHGVTVLIDSERIAGIATKFVPLMVFNEDKKSSKAHIAVTGTLKKPRVDIWAENLTYQPPVGPLATNLKAYITYYKTPDSSVLEFNSLKGNIKKSDFAGSGQLDLDTGNIFMDFDVNKLNARLYTPDSFNAELPDRLTGNVKIRTNAYMGAYVAIDWNAEGKGGLLEQLATNGRVYYEFGDMRFTEARVFSDMLSADTSGRIIKKDEGYFLKLKLKVNAPKFGKIMSSKSLPSFISKADFKGTVRGILSNPVVAGYGTASDINAAGIRIPYIGGGLYIDKTSIALKGGSGRLKGGKIKLSGGLSWSDGVWIYGKSNLQDIPASYFSSLLKGKISGKIKISGSPSKLSGKITAQMPSGSMGGVEVANAAVDLKLKRGALHIKRMSALLDGAPVFLRGKIDEDGELALKLNLKQFSVDRFTNDVLQGSADIDVKIGGTLSEPYVSGSTVLRHTRLYGRPKRDSRIVFSGRTSDGKPAFRGTLMSLINIRGEYGAFDFVKADFSFKHMNPSSLLPPGMLENYGIKAGLSGKGNFKLSSSGGIIATISPSHAVIFIKGIKDPYLPDRPEEVLKLADKAELKFDNGKVTVRNFRVKGHYTDAVVNVEADRDRALLALKGDLNVGLIPYFMESGMLDTVTGSINTDLTAKLSTSGVAFKGNVFFAGNKVFLADQEKPLILRAGKLTFSKNRLLLSGVRIVYDEEETDLSGSIALNKWMIPRKYMLNASGNVSAGVLAALSEDTFYTTKGRFGVSMRISGNAASPDINGRIFPKEKVELMMRSGREIALLPGGNLEFINKQLSFNELKIGMGEGVIALDGNLVWMDNAPKAADLTINIMNVVERSGSDYEAELSGKLKLSSTSDETLKLAGKIDVLNARYTKKYDVNLVDKLLTPAERVSEDSGSSLDSVPWLKNMILDITVQLTGDVEVDNNFAQMRLEGGVSVDGSLSEPKLGGRINLSSGTFRIPMLRGTYDIKEGSIDFDRAGLVGHKKNEAYINVLGEMIFIDRLDNEHVINLKIHGFMSQIKMEWSSSSGLNSSQVLTLLMLNRTPDEIRRGETGGIPDIGGIFEGYVPLDLQLGLTSDAIKLYVDRKFLANHLILRGNVEVGFMGRQEQDASLTFRLHDNVRIQSRARRRISEENTVQSSEDIYQGRIELKYKMSLKGSWKDILGL